MLHDFLLANRARLIDRCRVLVETRSGPKVPGSELAHGIPIFLDQIIETLTVQQRRAIPTHQSSPFESRAESNPDVGPMARLHGRDLLREGFTIEQVIRDYGDVCQTVTNLAVETGAPISVDEFRTFNRCLDDAIAAAVAEYSLRTGEIALAQVNAALSAAQLDLHRAQLRALHDSLTGIPNRRLFDDRLAQAIALAGRHNWTLAVMFLDLDHFKKVNDDHGHPAGDAALKIIAQRLQHYVRDEDTICRNGGDEFLFLLMNPKGRPNIDHIAESVLRTLAQPVAVGGVEFVVEPSIGVAIYPQHGATGEELIASADQAMYRAKRHPRGIVFCDRRIRRRKPARARSAGQ
jgi:diguanylate cyclase (GGDEF)-like protein